MPALFVPRDCRQVVAATRIELRIFERRTGSQDAGQAAADQFTGDRGFELVADRDLPAGGEQTVHVSRSGMMRQTGHRGLVALRERQPEDLGGDDGIFAKDLIEVAETKKQDCPRGELLTKLAVLPLHRGFFFHCVEGNSPQTRAQERTTLPHPCGVGSCSHQLGGELG